MDRVVHFVFSLALLLSASGMCAAEQDRQPPYISQYMHRTWLPSDGVLPAPPTTIAFTPDAYAWVGTDNGVFRFDGVRFVPETRIVNEQIESLSVDRDRSLWVGTSVGLHHFVNDVDRTVGPRAYVQDIAQGNDGTIWLASGKHFANGLGPHCRVEKDDLICGGTPSKDSDYVASGVAGGAWFVEGPEIDTLCHATRDSEQCISSDRSDIGPHGTRFYALRDTQAGLLVGVGGSRPPWIGRWRDGAMSKVTDLPGSDIGTEVNVIRTSADGQTLWIGTTNSGLYRFSNGHIQGFAAKDGLTSNNVFDVKIDGEGSVWTVTSAGLDQFYERPVQTWSMKEGMSEENVHSISVDSKGRVYAASFHAIDVIEDNRVRPITEKDGLPGKFIAALYADHDDTVWIGTDSTAWTLRDGHFKPSNIAMPDSSLVQMNQDPRGTYYFWGDYLMQMNAAGTKGFDFRAAFGDDPGFAPDGIEGVWVALDGRPPVHVTDEQMVSTGDTPPADAITISTPRFHDGRLWSPTYKGFLVWKDGHFKQLGSRNGLDFRRPYASIFDSDGNLWVMTERGYLEVESRELKAWLDDDTARVHPHVFGIGDGARPGYASFTPNAQLAPNGDLWFATNIYAQRITPRALNLNRRPPRVAIEGVSVDGRVLAATSSLQTATNPHSTVIDYTAFSFINPSQMQFRYKLEGIDEQWQDVRSRRQAIYTDLPPGHFTFQVAAANCDGVWSENGATLTFTVPPAMYQTWWFRVLLAIAALAVLAVAYRRRQELAVRAVRERLFARIAERERIARDLHDTFFQGIQGLLLRFQTGVSSMRRDDPARAPLLEALDQSDQVMLEGRELVLDLRERLDGDKPLEAVFKAMGEDLTELHAIYFALSVDGTSRPIVTGVRDELFRIGKEAIINAFRHAAASRIDVFVRYGADAFAIDVADNGKGIDDAVIARGRRPGHWGLPGMRERAAGIGAAIDVESTPGSGTRVAIRLPANLAYAKVQLRQTSSR